VTVVSLSLILLLCCCKKNWWDAGLVMCLGQDADWHMVHLMPLPFTISCFSKIQIGSGTGWPEWSRTKSRQP